MDVFSVIGKIMDVAVFDEECAATGFLGCLIEGFFVFCFLDFGAAFAFLFFDVFFATDVLEEGDDCAPPHEEVQRLIKRISMKKYNRF